MKYKDQRSSAAKLFPEIVGIIMNNSYCFTNILGAINADPVLNQRALSLKDIPSEWTYRWAKFIGDKDHMRQFVTESEWAYH